MCYYVTLAVGGVTGDELNAALREAGPPVRFDGVTNHHVTGHLAADEVYLVRGDSHCDCGTWLGEANRRTGQRAKYDVTERDLARQKAKGWSEQKIQRWLTEKLRATESAKAKEERDNGFDDGYPWIGVVKTALEVAQARSVGVMLHWYSGQLSERIAFSRRAFRLADLGVELLAEMPEDTLYTFALKG